jgi:hypothetical protein
MLWALPLLVAGMAHAAQDATTGATHALLINGGAKPASNYQSHLHHLQDMIVLLRTRGIPSQRIHIFSADGTAEGADLAVRDCAPEGYSLIAGTRTGRALRPSIELTDTRWPLQTVEPATEEALERWFRAAGSRLAAGDRLLLFVTDHGTGRSKNAEENAISLWGEELTVSELRRLLDLLDALYALRPLWLPSLVLSLAACAGLALIAWG